METFLNGSLAAPMAAALFAAAATALAVRLAKVEVAATVEARLTLALGLLVLVLPPLLSLLPGHVRVFSYHGLMHASIVYQILEGVVPPGDSFFGGEPLRYAWAHHLLIAGIVRVLGVSPPTAFALFNGVALLAFVGGALALAGRLTRDRGAWLLCTLVSLYGVAIFSRGPLATVAAALGAAQTDFAVLALEKFVHVNSNQAGLVCFVFGLLGLIRVAEEARRPLGWATLTLSVLGAAFLYPLVWLPLALCVGTSALLLYRSGALTTTQIVGVAACGVAATALALPYLLQIQGGRGQSALGFSFEAAHLVRNGTNLLLTLAAPLALIAARRREMAALVLDSPVAVRVLVASAATTAIAYLLLHAPTHSEYKLLALSCLSVAPLVGVALADWMRRRRVVAAFAVFVVSLPAAVHLHEMLVTPLGDTSRVVEDGPLLRQVDPEANAVDDWIRSQTSPTAVFLDTALTLPPFAHRTLYLALDPDPADPRRAELLQGWGLPPSTWLSTSLGRSHAAVNERFAVIQAVLRGAAAATSRDRAIDELMQGSSGREVYVVTRIPSARARLAADERFQLGFRAGSLAVFRLTNPFPKRPADALSKTDDAAQGSGRAGSARLSRDLAEVANGAPGRAGGHERVGLQGQ